MTKQPVLTDFPLAVFATAKRRHQATIREARQSSIRDSLSGYSQVFGDVLPPEFLSSIDSTKRQRHFGQRPVFWAWLAQILEGNTSCSHAVSLVQSWARSAQLTVPASDTSAYCQARQRIDTSFLKAIHQRTLTHLQTGVNAKDRWRGLQLKAIDGTNCQLPDTTANQERFPQPSGQKLGCGFPVLAGVGLVDLSHGGIIDFSSSPWSMHDSTTAPQLLHHLEPDDLLLADRAFCSYELIANIVEKQGAHCLMRLHQARHRRLDWRKGKRLSPVERLITWHKPQQPLGSTLTREEWECLPKRLTLRHIKLGYENRAGDKSELVLVTDLLDPIAYPVEELADLYLARWQIELTFRDLKTTMRLERLEVKSPELAEKTVLMIQIAYNLLRLLMQKAAAEEGLKVHRLSVRSCLDCLIHRQHLFRGLSHRSRKRRETFDHLIEDLATRRINYRPYRQEPRATKRRPKTYQLLTKPRGEFKEIPHRESYRKSA